jgi:PIN domain nuclease of toxin-antitoxin system
VILVDTHVVVWRALDPGRIPAKTRALLDRAEGRGILRMCEITLLEIAMLIRRGRLGTELDCREFLALVLASHDYILEGLDPEIAALAMELPGTVNKDPADRVILATALRLGGRLVTADANLREAGVVATIW